MVEITKRTFLSFHCRTERKKVKLILRSHEAVEEVKNALIDYLVIWNDKEWVDWETIEMVLNDLGHIKFWKMLPYSKFLAEAESSISIKNMEVLRKAPY